VLDAFIARREARAGVREHAAENIEARPFPQLSGVLIEKPAFDHRASSALKK
jgi:hypothetical protein